MPLTKTGKKVLKSMREQYGERAEEVFYASINKGVTGSKKWHKNTGSHSPVKIQKREGTIGDSY